MIRDKLGSGRTKFPMTAYLVAGTQADQSDKNEVLVMKVGDLHKTMREEEDDDDDVRTRKKEEREKEEREKEELLLFFFFFFLSLFVCN